MVFLVGGPSLWVVRRSNPYSSRVSFKRLLRSISVFNELKHLNALYGTMMLYINLLFSLLTYKRMFVVAHTLNYFSQVRFTYIDV